MPSFARVTSLLCAMVALTSGPAFADQFVLFSARHDAVARQVVLVGSGFRSDMRIGLNGAALPTVSVTSAEMRAALPDLEPGTYRLVIDRRRAPSQRFILTVYPASAGGGGVPGPAGPMGPMGLQGPAGPQGAQGLAGLTGAQGPAGPAGLAGTTGATGAIGPVGPAGAAGVAGPMGPTGLMGPMGPAGATGAAGPVGPAGVAGVAGAMGPAGPQGPAGIAGPAGSVGATGPAGPMGLAGAMGPAGPQGAQGPAGPAGSSVGTEVVAANGTTFGTIVSFQPGSATLVAVQSQGVWLVAAVNPDGISPSSYLALYADSACATAPYLPLDTNPAPFFRLLQTVAPGNAIGYFAGNPMETRAFVAVSPLGRPDQCQTATGTGWDTSMLVGPLQTIDLTPFPAPFTVR